MSELKPRPVKLIDANALKRKIEQTYLPSDSLTAGVLYDLISTAPPINCNRRTQPDNEPLCAENENFIQTKYGYCFYVMDSRPFIYNLYVHPQYRRHGCSKVLLGLVIGEIQKSGYKGEIGIQAEPRENSIGLEYLTEYYKSMGLIVFEDCPPEGSKA